MKYLIYLTLLLFIPVGGFLTVDQSFRFYKRFKASEQLDKNIMFLRGCAKGGKSVYHFVTHVGVLDEETLNYLMSSCPQELQKVLLEEK